MTITNLQVDNTAFALELTTNQPGKDYQLLVKTAPPFPTTTQQGSIQLKTTATNMPQINISARANVLPIVMAIPYLIRMPAPPLTNPYPYTIWVRNNGTNAITLSEAAVNAKGVQAQIKEDLAGKQFTVSLNFPAGFELLAGEKVELNIKTSHPQFPVLKVPVKQF